MPVPTYLFIALYLLYSIVGSTLFFFSSQGWSMGIILVIFCFPCYLLGFLIIVIKTIIDRVKTVQIGEIGFLVILFMQVLAIITNTGDNGDGPGTYYFLEEFWKFLLPDSFLYSQSYLSMSFAFKMLYAIALTIGLVKIFWFPNFPRRQ